MIINGSDKNRTYSDPTIGIFEFFMYLYTRVGTQISPSLIKSSIHLDAHIVNPFRIPMIPIAMQILTIPNTQPTLSLANLSPNA
jgi:hypothetical protein